MNIILDPTVTKSRLLELEKELTDMIKSAQISNDIAVLKKLIPLKLAISIKTRR